METNRSATAPPHGTRAPSALGGLLLIVSASSAWCAPVDFRSDIQPIFAAHCVKCHGADQQKGGLRLDVASAALKGGDSGQVLAPGRSAESRLVKLVAGLDPKLVMPPKGGRLTAEQVATLRTWIDQGAPWPDDGPSARARSAHWSLQSLGSSALIESNFVRGTGSPARSMSTNPPQAGRKHASLLDSFILARLATNGLTLSPPADRATLIRRLSFDLIGLPPTPAEVDAFVADPAPGAYEKLVERLLASPQYGERWGRHWLDVARYTESQGFEYDKLRDHAWHYRDYVIRSFNEDKPYDRFMREQISGDVLEPVTSDGIVGASLLICGPWDEAGNGQANATQRALTREEELEDLISVVGQTFLGLTLNCARCHSHKFDPVSQEEYYRIKSVFDGVKHGERTIAPPSEVQARETRVAALKQQVATGQKEVARLEAEGRKRVLSRGPPGAAEPGPAPYARWEFDVTTNSPLPGELRGGGTIANGRLQLAKAGAYYQSGPLTRDIREKTLEAWVSLADLRQGGGAAISIESEDGRVFDAIVFGERQPRKWTAGSSGFERTRDLEAPEEAAPPGTLIHMAIVYQADHRIAVFRNGEPYGNPYTPGSPLQTFPAGRSRVLLGMRHTGGGKPFLTGEIQRAALHDRALSAEEVAASFRAAGLTIPLSEVLAGLNDAQRAERDAALARVTQARASLDAIQPLPVAYAGTRVQPEPTRLLRRGDVRTPAETVTAAGLAAIVDVEAEFGLAADAPEAQRRLKFAEWLADARHPLPARVMANRIWHWHFGQGLVATPNDFGVSGARPTHPELLDWLAAKFIESGWSVKALHRLIVNSATYRQGSGAVASEPVFSRSVSSESVPGQRGEHLALDNGPPGPLNTGLLNTGLLNTGLLNTGLLNTDLLNTDLLNSGRRAAAVDADNTLLWRFSPRRLEAEAVRDAVLAVSGQLNPAAGGPSFRPFEVQKFPVNAYAPVDKAGPEFNRRTVYRMNVNSGKEPMLDAFDCPDPSVKTPRRGITTTPLQALSLMNNSFVQRHAGHLATRALQESQQDLTKAVQTVYRLALGRAPTVEESRRALAAARERSLTNVCWVVLNSTEFVYVR